MMKDYGDDDGDDEDEDDDDDEDEDEDECVLLSWIEQVM